MKKVLKRAAFIVAVIIATPLILFSWAGIHLLRKEGLFVSIGQFLALFPGKIGSYLRSAYYFATLESCSWEVHIGFGSYFSHCGARLGRNVSIGSYCVLGTVAIGARTMIASRVSIPSGKRQHFDEQGSIDSQIRLERVAVGRGCWIGEGAILLADVGDGCVVSAGAVVTSALPGRCIAGGNPARVIKSLDNQG